MKISARLDVRALSRALSRVANTIETPALDAVADAFADELDHAREREGLSTPLVRSGDARRRHVGANDPESLARELGSPGRAPAPWLAPVLPAVRVPMRAAARTAVARALSRFKRRA